MIELRFYSLAGKLKTVKKESFETTEEMMKAAKEYACSQGYTNIKLVDENPYECFRITGDPPVGRPGRNIAIGDWDYSDV